MKRLQTYVFIGIIAAVQVAHADVGNIVSKIRKAPQNVSYSGIKTNKVFLGKKTIEARIKVSHKKPAYTKIEILRPDKMSGTIILRRDTSVFRGRKGNKNWVQIPGGSSIDIDFDSAMLLNYNVKVVGEATVADRKSILLHATPKSKADLQRKLWVDKDTYIIIKQKAFTSDGKLVHFSSYDSIKINPAFASGEFKVSGTVASQKSRHSQFRVTTPKYIPKGYKLAHKGFVTAGGRSCYHQYYVNGVSGISIFQRPLGKNEQVKREHYRQGANVLVFENNRISYVIVGEISQREINLIAESLSK